MNKIINFSINKKTFYIIFGVIITALYFLAFISLIVSRGNNWDYLIWHLGSRGLFPDLSQTVYEAKGLAPFSESNTIPTYPPFVYFVFSIIGNIIPGELTDSSLTNYYATPVYMFFIIFVVILLVSQLFKYLNCDYNIKLLIILFYFFSAPFIYCFERGNLVVLSVVFCTFFVFNYNSDNKLIRELSLVFLSFSASLKIYPALLGFLLITDKRYKEAVRCVIYGILIFTVPFFLLKDDYHMIIEGLINGVKFYSYNMSMDVFDWGFDFRIGVTSWAYIYGELFGISNRYIEILVIILNVSLALLLIMSYIFLKDKWKKVMSLMIFIIVLARFSWIYNIIYILPVIILFVNSLNEKEHLGLLDIFYSLLFVIMMSPMPYVELFSSLHGRQKISLNTFLSSVSFVLFIVVFFAEVLYELYKIEKSKKESLVD